MFAGIGMAMASDAIQSARYFAETGDGSMLGMYHPMYKTSVNCSSENVKELCTSESLSRRASLTKQKIVRFVLL